MLGSQKLNLLRTFKRVYLLPLFYTRPENMYTKRRFLQNKLQKKTPAINRGGFSWGIVLWHQLIVMRFQVFFAKVEQVHSLN